MLLEDTSTTAAIKHAEAHAARKSARVRVRGCEDDANTTTACAIFMQRGEGRTRNCRSSSWVMCNTRSFESLSYYSLARANHHQGCGGGGGGAVCHELPACEEARLRRPMFWNYGTEKVYELKCKRSFPPTPSFCCLLGYITKKKQKSGLKLEFSLQSQPPNQSPEPLLRR